MQNIIFHSDDYGISINSSQYILDCCEQGVLNSTAILANSPMMVECCQMLMPYVEQKRIQISVHLNLVEGKALASPDCLPTLTDENGFFRYSFEQLFFQTLTSKKTQLKQEIKQELFCQIQKVQDCFPGTVLGLDSHQHFHMIPLVFEALLEVIHEHQIPIRYIRMSQESLIPILKTPAIYRQIRPINIIKNILLNVFGWIDQPRLRAAGIKTYLFWGLIFSGDMNLDVVRALLPHFQKLAQKKDLPLEVLSHPCPVFDLSECLDPNKQEFVDFYFSEGRKREAVMLKSIHV